MTDAVGRLADAATAAVETLRGLLAASQPATVRLGAARAILTALIDVQTHADLVVRFRNSCRVSRLAWVSFEDLEWTSRSLLQLDACHAWSSAILPP